MKRMLSLLLALLLLVGCLTSCGSTKPADESLAGSEITEETPKEPVQESEKPEEPAEAPANSTELFYQYLSDTVIPEMGLSNLNSVSVDTEGFEKEYPAKLGDEGFLGLVSASIRDFDGDGSDEMVTFSLVNSQIFHTWLREYIRDDMWLLSVVGLQLDLYALEDGQVVHKDTDANLTWIDGLSWGPMAAGLEQYEDKIYIWGKAHSENTSTYGNAPFCISHVENGVFVRDYVDGMTWGQEDLSEELSEVATSHMIIRNTPLIDVANAVDRYPNSADKWTETFGERLVMNLWLEGDWDNWGLLHADVEDFTNLRYILEHKDYNIAPLPIEPLPQVGSEGGLADKAKAFAETQFNNEISSINNWESEGTFHSEITLFSGNVLRLRYDMVSGEFTQIILNADDMESWYQEKDLLLQHPDLNLNADSISPMLGKCSMTAFSGGVDAGDYTVTIVEVMSAVLSLTPNK